MKADLPLENWAVQSVIQVESLRIEKDKEPAEMRYYSIYRPIVQSPDPAPTIWRQCSPGINALLI